MAQSTKELLEYSHNVIEASRALREALKQDCLRSSEAIAAAKKAVESSKAILRDVEKWPSAPSLTDTI